MQNINFDLFEDIPAKVSSGPALRLSVNEKGMVSINSALSRAVGDQREFRAQKYPDGSCFALFRDEAPNIKFSQKSLNSFQPGLASSLRGLGYNFPVVYILEWDEAHKVWVGHCSEISSPPKLSSIKSSVAGRKKTLDKCEKKYGSFLRVRNTMWRLLFVRFALKGSCHMTVSTLPAHGTLF